MSEHDRYERGSLRVVDDNRSYDDYPFEPLDAEDEKEDGPRVPVAALPHQCGAWIIGGREEVSALIADLEAALVKLSAPQSTEEGSCACGEVNRMEAPYHLTVSGEHTQKKCVRFNHG